MCFNANFGNLATGFLFRLKKHILDGSNLKTVQKFLAESKREAALLGLTLAAAAVACRLRLLRLGPRLLCLPLWRWEGVGTSDLRLAMLQGS